MPRIAGINIPEQKRIVIALTYVYGIGLSLSKKILAETNIGPSVKAKDLSPDEINQLKQIIEKDYKLKGYLCEHCQLLKAGAIKNCPNCSSPTSEVDVIEEILEFAERTDAEIEFVDDEEIHNLGHVGAILRYK